MTDTLGMSEFREACRQAEQCPFCARRRQDEQRYWRFFLGEYVNDGEINARLWKSYGFCRRHAAQLLIENDGLGIAIVYERVLHVWQEALENLAPDADGVGAAGMAHLAQRLLHPQETAGTRAADGLEPTGPCPACVSADGSEQFLLSEIAEALEREDRGEAWRWLADSFGLCLPHFRSLVAEMHDEVVVRHLCALQRERIAALRGRLEEYVRKQDYRFHDEPCSDVERRSWRDAAALLVGSITRTQT